MQLNSTKIGLFLLGCCSLLLTACVDAEIGEAVEYDDYYQTLDDADASILGLYGKVMELSGQIVVLNELRSDLLDVTPNASVDLQEINRHQPGADNPWSNVLPFYAVIQNCNDILFNFDKMYKENKLTADQYKERYADVGAVRCWLYYQLGVHFGKVPYITEPIVDYTDLDRYKDRVLDLDALIDELILFMRSLPSLEAYQNSKLVDGDATVDGYSLIPFFINKKCLLGDLYLFANRYDEAAAIYREVLAFGEDLDATNRNQYRKNRLYSYVWVPSNGTVDYFAVLYNRFKPEDMASLYNAWTGMFALSADDRGVREEMIWEMSYDHKFAPTYPFIELFSQGGKGKYLLKPSEHALLNLWGSEVQNNGFPHDVRGVLGGVAKAASGDYVVAKYSMNYNQTKPLEQSGKWFLYRAALLHLRYAEAANRAGYPKLALAFLNDGIKGGQFSWKREDGSTYRGDSIQQSSFGPGRNYPAPYYFDARQSDRPYFRAPWRDGAGVRGRANLPGITLDGITSKQDSIAFIEQKLIREAALELAFEGHRWTDLIRVARRNQKPQEQINAYTGVQFLNDVLAGKYQLSGTPMPDLSDESKWYLPLYE